MAVHRNKSFLFLVSACLAGIPCTHDGRDNTLIAVKQLVDEDKALAVCPEILGCLSSPRMQSEIVGGDGLDVLEGRARVLTRSGRDVSRNFIEGAKKALELAKIYKVKMAIFKSHSPSCGVGKIYDGTFTKALKKGNGVTASLLIRYGIALCTEEDDWNAR